MPRFRANDRLKCLVRDEKRTPFKTNSIPEERRRKGGKKAKQLNLKIRRNCHEWNFKQEFMVRWQVHSRDYKSPRPVGRRFIMKSPFNYEFIDCLHPATPDAWWRPRSREGVDFTLLFPEKYGFPLYATRRFRRNLFSRCPVLSFVFKKKTRPSYDLSSRRDRSLSPSSLKVKTGLVENGNIHARAHTLCFATGSNRETHGMQQVSEPWFTWEMNVLSRMEHALNIPQCKGIRSIDRKRCVDPGIVYGVVSQFVACERKIIVDRLSHQFFFFLLFFHLFPRNCYPSFTDSIVIHLNWI